MQQLCDALKVALLSYRHVSLMTYLQFIMINHGRYLRLNAKIIISLRGTLYSTVPLLQTLQTQLCAVVYIYIYIITCILYPPKDDSKVVIRVMLFQAIHTLPAKTPRQYCHRIGRTGRDGELGASKPVSATKVGLFRIFLLRWCFFLQIKDNPKINWDNLGTDSSFRNCL